MQVREYLVRVGEEILGDEAVEVMQLRLRDGGNVKLRDGGNVKLWKGCARNADIGRGP